MSKIVRLINKYQYFWVRIFISLYLGYFFISMLEQHVLVENLLGSQQGVLKALTLGVPIIAIILCALFFLGIFVPLASLSLFLCYQFEFTFLPIPKEVQAAYISIILLLYTFFHKKTNGFSCLKSTLSDSSSWYLALFLAVYLGFSVSGLSKLFYEPWLNGKAISYFCTTSQIGILNNTLLCSMVPKSLMGFIVLFVEITSLPLALFRKTRPVTWFLNTCLHLCIPFFLYVWPVSVGVLLMQMILFDSRWIVLETQN
jgi:hypothetical protein